MTALRALAGWARVIRLAWHDQVVRDAEGLSAADRRLIAWVAALRATDSDSLP